MSDPFAKESTSASIRKIFRARSAARSRDDGKGRSMAGPFLSGILFILTIQAIFGPALSPPALSSLQSKGPAVSGGTIDWQNAPRVDLVVRTYGGSLHIMWNTFMPTYLLFWPIQAWASSGLVFILDADSASDHEQGTVLENLALASRVRVKYEAPAPEGVLCSDWRREGYARQQYSNFYADLYSDAEFLAVVDTDAAFRVPVIPSDLFEDGKPIVKGFNQVNQWTSQVAVKAIGGHRGIGRFMTRYSFPVVLKASHLPEVRAGIAKNLGAATFEEAFHMICSQGPGSYSQFEIIFNYLWYNINDGYAWHIADPASGSFEEITGANRPHATEDAAVISKNIPVVLPMRHMGKAIDENSIGPASLFKNLCRGSDYKAGFCTTVEATETDGVPITGKWTAGGVEWPSTYKDHVHKVAGARPAFDWHRETAEDLVHPG